ncbi:MAG: methyltransferase domain-containing protein, partial [Planctomycetota bacterium]|nr:methyltransferase domain-containing protein [Planctomycetota bacterium]
MARQTDDRSRMVRTRGDTEQKLNAWRKRSPLSPYWMDWTLLRRSIEALVEHAQGKLLDIGVSEAPYRHLFLPRVDRYVGLEYPPTILDKRPDLWDVLHIAKDSVQVWGDGTALCFHDGTFETILATEVLEHLPNPQLLLNDAARVLAPGGKFLATVPFSQPLHELPGDFYRFTPTTLERMVTEAGLIVEEIRPRGNFANAVGALSAQFLSRWLAAEVRLPDGGVKLSKWRALLFMPLFAAVQLFFHVAAKFNND